MKVLMVLGLALLVVGCDMQRFNEGHRVVAKIQRDPNDKCRVLVQIEGSGMDVMLFAARIENC